MFITGRVTSVNIKGLGPNSAELLFTVQNKADHQTIMVTAFPSYEPQVFTAMAAFVTGAYFSGKKITAGYVERLDETNYAVEVGAAVEPKRRRLSKP